MTATGGVKTHWVIRLLLILGIVACIAALKLTA
jgi:hypothetical protein